MRETYTIDRDFLFKTNIYEITSISIEDNYDINGSYIEGELIISGDYRLHEISINKEDFSFKLPFKHEIKNNINLDSVELEITDFSYEFNNEDEIKIHVEYTINGEENIIEFDDEKKLDDFLEIHDAEVIDLSNDSNLSPNEEIDISKRAEEIDQILDETNNTIELDNTIDHNMLLNNIKKEEAYVKYHIHTVTMEDSIDSICAKYNININTLKKYNTFDVLELNMKLLIPENEES